MLICSEQKMMYNTMYTEFLIVVNQSWLTRCLLNIDALQQVQNHNGHFWNKGQGNNYKVINICVIWKGFILLKVCITCQILSLLFLCFKSHSQC